MKKCKTGYYYCQTDKKCKPIPKGYRIGYGGYLRNEKDDDDSNGKKNGNGNGHSGNGNGNGNGGNGNGNGGNGGGNGGGMSEGSLHKWFKGSKSKDGKPGWVNVKTGGTCASDEPGEGTPKCVSSSKRASMSKSERDSASRRKKAADPGQQSKTGAAKPTYVSTDKPKKKMKEEIQITESDRKGKGSGSKDACYHKVKSRYSVWPSAYASGALVKCRKVGAANWGNSSKKEEFEPTGISFQQFQEKCWKGYEKKGMKTMFGKRYPNCVKKEEVENVDEKIKYDKSGSSMDYFLGADPKKTQHYKDTVKKKTKKEEVQRDEYGDPIGGPKISKKQKAKNLTMNEPDKQHTTDTSEGIAYGITRGSGKPSGQMAAFGKKKKENPYSLKNKLKMVIRGAAQKERAKAGVTSEEVISERQKDSDNQRLSQERGRSNYGKASVRNMRATGTGGNAADPAERLVAMDARHKAHKEKRGVKTKVKEEVGVSSSAMMMKARKEAELRKKEQEAVSKKMKKEEIKIESDLLVQDWKKDDIKFTEIETIDIIKPEPLNPSDWRNELDESAAWQRKEGKSKSGGLNQKGVDSYRAANPGSKLKTAVTTKPSKLKKGSKAANRRKSFCSRMKGMKKKLTSAKTARDPDSRINKSLRKWNCW